MACMGRWHEACMPRADRLTLLVMSIEDDMAPTRDWEPYATCASGCFVHCSRAPNGSEIVGGGNSRSGVACGSAILHHCCSPSRTLIEIYFGFS